MKELKIENLKFPFRFRNKDTYLEYEAIRYVYDIENFYNEAKIKLLFKYFGENKKDLQYTIDFDIFNTYMEIYPYNK